MRIGFQGDYFSNNYYAAKQYSEINNLKFEAVPLINSYPVFSALINDDIKIGVVAYKNSIAGNVCETKEALKEFGLHVEELCEIVLPIHHCLFTLPGNDINIKYIYSHEQALHQCENYIKLHYPDAKIEKEKDTSLAALRLASNEYASNSAVICNRNCGDYYKLRLVQEIIETERNNHTTFKVYKKKS